MYNGCLLRFVLLLLLSCFVLFPSNHAADYLRKPGNRRRHTYRELSQGGLKDQWPRQTPRKLARAEDPGQMEDADLRGDQQQQQHRPTPQQTHLIKSLERYLRSIARLGSSTFHIAQLDPFLIKEQVFDWQSDRSSIRGVTKDVRARGLAGLRIQDLRIDPNAGTLQTSVIVPSLVLQGWYDLQGNILRLIELSGRGSFSIAFNDIVVHVDGLLLPDAQGILNLKNLSLDIDFGTVESNIQNLNHESKSAFLVNSMVVHNAHSVFAAIKPGLMKNLAKSLMEKANRRFQLSNISKNIFEKRDPK